MMPQRIRAIEDFTLLYDLANSDASYIAEDTGDCVGAGAEIINDVNGDSYYDFLVSAWCAVSGNFSGKIYLVFGKASGWENNVNLSEADASFVGENADDWAGVFSSVSSAGDVNGDGFGDILIGAYKYDNILTDEGKVYIIFGKETGWTMNMSLANSDASFVGEESNGIELGYSVDNLGDVNGDGLDDIILGAEGGNAKAYLVFGKENSWQNNVSISNADVIFTPEENSGLFVAGLGDVNGDGINDMAFGQDFNNEHGITSGQSYLVFGRDGGWVSPYSLADADASFYGEVAGDRSGVEISNGGDVNGDSYNDFLIGSYFNDEGETDAGQIYLILGKSSGWAMDTSLLDSAASYLGDSENQIGDPIRLGDLNSDGFSDIIFPAPYAPSAT
ncbi:MAG: integrin alpha, partial [Candidatus Dojkabacteria bacterium]|nr:integrin alpha [Candidatus Dojkabacteria bacterium]